MGFVLEISYPEKCFLFVDQLFILCLGLGFRDLSLRNVSPFREKSFPEECFLFLNQFVILCLGLVFKRPLSEKFFLGKSFPEKCFLFLDQLFLPPLVLCLKDLCMRNVSSFLKNPFLRNVTYFQIVF